MIDGVLQRDLRRLDGAHQDAFQIGVVRCKVSCRVAGQAGDGKDGALGRLHDGFIRRFHTGGQRLGKVLAVCFQLSLERFGKAPEQKRKNDARVSARAAQKRRRRYVGSLCQRLRAALFEILRRSSEGHAHIGAGVAVGHREDVQLVDFLLFLLNCGAGGYDHPGKCRAVHGLSQSQYTSGCARALSQW